ncbi:MAG: hypothetical protein AB8H80_20815 [Planctomycetota bacterium]
MRPRPTAYRSPLCVAGITLALLTATSCGGKTKPVDRSNRDLAWKYGPTNGSATSTHLRGSGTQGGSAMAEGWRCKLREGKRVTVTPYKLEKKHPLLGKAKLAVGLFEPSGEMLELLFSDPITADSSSFDFELKAETSKKLNDIVIWYKDVE